LFAFENTFWTRLNIRGREGSETICRVKLFLRTKPGNVERIIMFFLWKSILRQYNC
jgi:hypothetical protein